jgi:hypothetical protein
VNAYANDPRVTRANDYQYDVHGDDEYLVSDSAVTRPVAPSSEWWIDLGILAAGDKASFTSRGPFATADDAIRSLIGDPQ